MLKSLFLIALLSLAGCRPEIDARIEKALTDYYSPERKTVEYDPVNKRWNVTSDSYSGYKYVSHEITRALVFPDDTVYVIRHDYVIDLSAKGMIIEDAVATSYVRVSFEDDTTVAVIDGTVWEENGRWIKDGKDVTKLSKK